MKIKNSSKAVLAGALALGLGFVAAPAMAQEELPEPSVTASPTVFEAGSWGEGVEIELTLPESVAEEDIIAVSLYVAAVHGDGAGIVGEVALAAEEGEAGVYTGTVVPESAPEVAESEEGPFYSAGGYYVVEGAEGPEYVYGTDIELYVIDAELDFIGPSEATSAELAEGVEVELRGFQPGEAITVTFQDTEDVFEVEAGENGRFIGDASASPTSVGDVITLIAEGESGTVTLEITVVASDDDDDDAPTPPERVDTGL